MVSAVDELVYNVKLDNNLKVHQKRIAHKVYIGPDQMYIRVVFPKGVNIFHQVLKLPSSI